MNEEPKAPEYELNLDEIEPQKHVWVERGDVISCEGAQHPSHRHFKVKKHREKE